MGINLKRLIVICILLIHTISIAQNLDFGLVGYWSFDGNANDISGNGNNGIVHNATLTFDRCGNPNSAYNFNGVGNYIEVQNSTSIASIFSNNEISISAWIKIDDWYISNKKWFIIAELSKGNQFASFGFCLTPSSMYFFDEYNYNFNLNELYHLVVTYNKTDSQLRFYVNGNIVNQVKTSKNLTDVAGTLKFGWSPYGSEEFSKGIIDDIRIYNRALTDKEVLMLYNLPTKKSEIRTIDTTVNVGTENIHIPLFYNINCKKMLPNILSFTANIKFNATTFLPIGITKGAIIKDSIDKDYFRNLTIKCDIVYTKDDDSVLTELIGIALLGDSWTPIEITDFKWSNSYIEIDTLINGSLRTRACALPIRRVQLYSTNDFTIHPNPVNDFIVITSNEQNQNDAIICNSVGIEVKRVKVLNREFEVDISRLSAGVYFIKIDDNIKMFVKI